ncbi:MAG: hypothetical protein KDA33_11575, partial [Phycisphaerales bacterium]|nr:hypothetical protein [Phycisphaerales bacterium]
MLKKRLALSAAAIVLSLSALWTSPALADDAPPPAPKTIDRSLPPGEATKVPKEDLELMVKPLTRDELVIEADAWMGLLREQVDRISKEELKVKRANREIAEAKQKAEQAAEKKEEAKAVAEDKKDEARTVAEKPDDHADNAPEEAEREAASASQEAQNAEKEEVAAKQAAEAKAEEKKEKLDSVVTLRDERTKIVDRLNIILTELKAKGGDRTAYDTYVTAVSGTKIDVSDASAAWVTIKGWVVSEEGGMRWAKNIGLFLLTLFAFWILARIVGRAVRRAVKMMRGTSDLLRDFLV